MLTTLLSLYASTRILGAGLPDQTLDNWNSSSLLEATALPKQSVNNIAPLLKAKSVLAVDLKNGMPLYSQNIYERRPIASITKLMTATIILEENKLTDVVTITKAASQIEGSKV